MSEDQRALRLLKLHEKLKGKQHSNWRDHWDSVAKVVIPFKDNIYQQRTPGDKTNNNLFDGTAVRSNTRLANALHTLLTNPSVKWFELTTGDSDLDANEEVKLYLQKGEEKIRETLNNSNFQTEVHEVYLDIGSFGTGPMRMEPDELEKVRFYSLPVFEANCDENLRGRIDTVSREFKVSIQRIVEEYGEEVLEMHQDLKQTFQDKPEQEFEIVHIVQPRSAGSNTKLKFESVHIIKKLAIIVRDKGFSIFPYAVPRWMKMSGEMYGRSPGMEALPDARSLQAMDKVNIQGAQLAMAPPLQGTDGSLLRPLQFKPFGMNWRRPGSEEIKPVVTGARPDIGIQLIEYKRDAVKEAYLDKQLTLVENDRMTATEVVQRRDEQLRELSAILVRLDRELLSPVINFTFAQIEGELPTPPDVLKNKADIGIRYTSSIAKAQLSSETENLNRAVSKIANIVEAQPEVFDNIDGDQAFRHTANILGVDQRFLRGEDEVKKIRKQRADAIAQQRQNEQAQAEADVINKAGAVVSGGE